MGATASTNSSKQPSSRTNNRVTTADEDTVVRLLLPVYYTGDELSPEDIALVAKSWKIIASNQAVPFLQLKKVDPSVTAQSCIEYFGDEFARRFLEVHPLAKSMFTKSTMKQGSLFSRMISFTVKALDDTDKFDKTFMTLTTSHNRMGVRAVEYGIFGEVLFYTLRKTLGPEAYSAAVHYAWVKVMSRILRVIIPMVVRFEMTLAANNSAKLPGQIKGAPQRGYQPHLQQDTSMFSSNRSTAVHSGDGAIERQPATLTTQR